MTQAEYAQLVVDLQVNMVIFAIIAAAVAALTWWAVMNVLHLVSDLLRFAWRVLVTERRRAVPQRPAMLVDHTVKDLRHAAL
jgi:hypothetical protein